MTIPPAFDPAAAADPDAGIFGLPLDRTSARIVLLPVPFDATTSYRPGTADGPAALRNASMQVDLFDRRFGRVYEQGIFMEPISEEIRELSRRAARAARPIIDAGGPEAGNHEHTKLLAEVNSASERVNAFVYQHTARVLAEGKIPGLIGGEHSVPFGAIQAVAEKYPGVGILHIDAHMDCRDAFEGFTWSHASIMHNVLSRLPNVRKIVQIGIRDFSEDEVEFAARQGSRVTTAFDEDWAQAQAGGTTFLKLCEQTIAQLPKDVYISFDIDGLDPSLCPHTGTPVPGGLSFHQATMLLDLVRKGRRIVGFDLVEVAPGAETEPEWDANVGARALYKLCGAAREPSRS